MILLWIVLLLACLTSLGMLVWYCTLTSLGPLELAGHLIGRWRNRHFYEGVDLRKEV